MAIITNSYNLNYETISRNQPIEQIYLECDTTLSPVTISLFPIYKTNNFYNIKIFISDYGNNAATNNITIGCSTGDIINTLGNTQVVINTNGGSLELQIAGNNKWLSLGQKLNNTIEIPRPEINLSISQNNVIGQELYAHYLPPINDSFLNYNPKYYLFMQRSRLNSIKKDINGVLYKKKKPSGIFHPTHQNGINFPNGAFYSGTTQIPLDTEFSISNTPYIKSLINMNPLQFVRYSPSGGLIQNDWVVPNLLNFPCANIQIKIQGRRANSPPRSSLMFLAIGIENPDKNSNYPIIFGELSIPFKLALKKQAGIIFNGNEYSAIQGVQYLLNSSSVKTQYKL